MTEKTTVTIITLTYKKFGGFIDTIESVAVQNYKNIEYIVADDGSDNFPEDVFDDYCKKYSKRMNIRLIRQTENVGTVRNFNNAIKEAKGDYIFTLSCNDIFMNDTIVSKIVTEFVKTDCNVIVTSRALYSDNKDIISIKPHVLERKQIEQKNARQQYELYVSGRLFDMISGSTAYYKKSVFQEVGYFDESYRLLEDAPFFEKYMWNNKVNFRYDIVSILYEDSGISSGKSFNSTYNADLEQYKYMQRYTHIPELTKKTRNDLQYAMELHKATNKIQKMRVYLMHPSISVFNFLYRLRRNVFGLLDRQYIRLLMK